MDDVEFKTCRFCQEKIRAAAIKCRYCGEFLESAPAMALSTYIEVEGCVTGSSEAPRSKKPVAPHYLLRHWRGELSLRESFLVNGAAVAAIFTATIFLAHKVPAVESIVYAVLFGLCLWEAVGTWRSSGTHVENGGEQHWAVRAKIFVSLAALAVAWIAMGKIARQTVALATDRTSPAYEIRILPGDTEVEFNGPLRPGAAEGLARVLQRHAQVRTLHLNSRGGDLAEAFAMAQLITGCELDTFVSQDCQGAAALLFVAGKERGVGAQASIGFEEVGSAGMTERQREELEGNALDIFRESEVKKAFANRALTSPHDQMWFPSVEEMRSAGVITISSASFLMTDASRDQHR